MHQGVPNAARVGLSCVKSSLGCRIERSRSMRKCKTPFDGCRQIPLVTTAPSHRATRSCSSYTVRCRELLLPYGARPKTHRHKHKTTHNVAVCDVNGEAHAVSAHMNRTRRLAHEDSTLHTRPLLDSGTCEDQPTRFAERSMTNSAALTYQGRYGNINLKLMLAKRVTED